MRELNELVHLVTTDRATDPRLDVTYSPNEAHYEHINGVDIPHCWLCRMELGNGVWVASGVTIEESIKQCYQLWKGDKE